jgi:hypothetical protein
MQCETHVKCDICNSNIAYYICSHIAVCDDCDISSLPNINPYYSYNGACCYCVLDGVLVPYEDYDYGDTNLPIMLGQLDAEFGKPHYTWDPSKNNIELFRNLYTIGYQSRIQSGKTIELKCKREWFNRVKAEQKGYDPPIKHPEIGNSELQLLPKDSVKIFLNKVETVYDLEEYLLDFIKSIYLDHAPSINCDEFQHAMFTTFDIDDPDFTVAVTNMFVDAATQTYIRQPMGKNTEIIISKSGTKFWYQNGEYHRVRGPAIEYPNNTEEWYFEGYQISEEISKKIERRVRRREDRTMAFIRDRMISIIYDPRKAVGKKRALESYQNLIDDTA